jgi:hypothetical protein
MNTKLISSSLAIAVICALSSGSAIANPPADIPSAPATTTPAADQTGPLTLSDSQMDSIVAGNPLAALGAAISGWVLGTGAGVVYCAVKGPNCGGATTKPKPAPKPQ